MSAPASVYLFEQDLLWTAIFWLSFAGFFAVGMWAANRERNMAPGENRDGGSKAAVYLFSSSAWRLLSACRTMFPRHASRRRRHRCSRWAC